MRIKSFEVENYRSIQHARLDLAGATTLVGPNNEGKSNVLRAVVCGMRTLSGFDGPQRVQRTITGRLFGVEQDFGGYEREQDLPVGLQGDPTAVTTSSSTFN